MSNYDIPAKTVLESRAALRSCLRTYALRQLKGHIARLVYQNLEVENAGLRSQEIDTLDTFESIGQTLAKRLQAIQEQLRDFDQQGWTEKFALKCTAKEKELDDEWNDNWRTHADGKKILQDLHRQLGLNINLLEFKKRILSVMASKKTELWRTADSILNDLIPTP